MIYLGALLACAPAEPPPKERRRDIAPDDFAAIGNEVGGVVLDCPTPPEMSERVRAALGALECRRDEPLTEWAARLAEDIHSPQADNRTMSPKTARRRAKKAANAAKGKP